MGVRIGNLLVDIFMYADDVGNKLCHIMSKNSRWSDLIQLYTSGQVSGKY